MKRKILSIIVALCMVIALLPAVTPAASAVAEWRYPESAPAAFTEGVNDTGTPGTEDDPYAISSAQALANLAYLVNHGNDYSGLYFQLTKDIVLNDDVLSDDGTLNSGDFTKWTPIGTDSTSSFRGTFDGNGKTVSGIYVSTSDDYQGLFGHLSGGTVENVGVIDSYIEGGSNVGGVVGFDTDATIQYCYNTGSVNSSGSTGGVVGCNYGTVRFCYNTGTVSGGSAVGGVAGFSYNNTTVEYCYNTGGVSGSNDIGGIVGCRNMCTLQYSYNTGGVSGSGSNVGGIAGASGWRIIDCYYDKQMCTCGDTGKPTSGMIGTGLWTGASDDGWTDEHWTFTDGLYPRLAGIANTDAAYVSASPIKLAYTSDSDYEACNSVKTDFTVGTANGVTWSAPANSAVFVLGGSGMIANTGSATLTATKNGVSKSVALSVSKKALSVVDSTAEYDTDMNPLAIANAGDLMYLAQQVKANGNVSYTDSSHPTGDGSTRAQNASYRQTDDIELGYWRDDGDGVVDDGEIYKDESHTTAYTESNWTPIGRSGITLSFSGKYDGNGKTVSGIYINTSDSLQGLFGQIYGGTVENVGVIDSYIEGGSYVGGVAGNNIHGGTVQYCYNTGSVTGSGSVGGVVGTNNGTVQCCYNTGSVAGSGRMVGGIAGDTNNGTIQYCYNTGRVTGGGNIVGGVAGGYKDDGTIQYCYNTGGITGSGSNVGGIIGCGACTSCYYDKQMCTVGDTGVPTSAMVGTGLQSSLGTASNWTFTDGLYPRLTGYVNENTDYNMDETDASLVSVSPVNLAYTSDTDFDTVEEVSSDMTLGVPENGESKPVRWTSTDSGIVGVSNGNATLEGSGGVTLVASLGGISKAVALTVSYTPPVIYVPGTSNTITVTETSSELFEDGGGAITVEADMRNAFSTSVEVRVTNTEENASDFGLGAGETAYPFDISLYIKGTDTKAEPEDGYAVTISLPVPDDLLGAKDRLSVMHQSGDGSATTLTSQLKQVNGVWYLVFEATEFSPYALVVSDAGTYDETAGLPYYLDSGENNTFIGFAADGRYIAPDDVTVLFKENPKSFTDVSGHWAETYINFVTERELFLGTGNGAFSPDAGMTRAMFATVIGRLYERSYGEIEVLSEHAFTDCDYGDYYGKYVDWASESGIAEGADGLFEPDREITREEMATVLYRFADFLGFLPADTGSELNYPDAGNISSWAEKAALYCRSTGIITGREGGNFVPQGTATRAEVAVILERFIENVLG